MFVVASAAFDEFEAGNQVTAFGASLGLTNGDVNGNFSHNIFSATGGMDVVDFDSAGGLLSLATRSRIPGGGGVPEPGTALLVGLALFGLAAARRHAVRI